MDACPNCNQAVKPGETECPACGTEFSLAQERISKQQAAEEQKQERRDKIISRITMLMEKMDETKLVDLLARANEIDEKKERAHPRHPCLIQTDYVTMSRAYQDYVKDISLGGVFIQTDESFSSGQEITLTLALAGHVKPFKITGQIVRSDQRGIGVKFGTMTPIQIDLVESLVSKVKSLNTAG